MQHNARHELFQRKCVTEKASIINDQCLKRTKLDHTFTLIFSIRHTPFHYTSHRQNFASTATIAGLALSSAMPIFGALVMLGFFRRVCGVVDSLVLFVGMMQCAGPPMVNITVMAGLSGTAAKDVSRMLLITYVVSMASWVVAVTCFLHILHSEDA